MGVILFHSDNASWTCPLTWTSYNNWTESGLVWIVFCKFSSHTKMYTCLCYLIRHGLSIISWISTTLIGTDSKIFPLEQCMGKNVEWGCLCYFKSSLNIIFIYIMTKLKKYELSHVKLSLPFTTNHLYSFLILLCAMFCGLSFWD